MTGMPSTIDDDTGSTTRAVASPHDVRTITQRRRRQASRRERGEGPGSGEDLRPRAVQADEVVPAVGDREGVAGGVAVPAEADGHAAVVVVGRGDVVDAVRAAL